MGKILNRIKTSENIVAVFLFKILLFIYERVVGSHFIHSFYDYYRFFRFSKGIYINTLSKYESVIIKEYHRIEKGLTYRDFRPYFGRKVIENLLNLIESNLDKYGFTSATKIAINTIEQYIIYHKNHGFEIIDFIKSINSRVESIRSKTGFKLESTIDKEGGILHIKKEDIVNNIPNRMADFFASRYSIRDFTNEEVEISKIRAAVKMAIKTPSVCNRQSWKCYLVSNKSNMAEILKLQNGNSGFGHTISKLLIVTTDLSSFHNGTERYQNWIDGGMFAMSLVYGLHAIGLGSCCLNWSAYFYNDIKLRPLTNIPRNESVIMMIAVGNIPKQLKVAQSPRKKIEEVLKII